MTVGGDFDAQMRKIRDVRFEFTRMEVELQYLGMHVVTDFLRALGLGPDELLTKLRQFNDWVTHNMPAISQKIVKWFMPIWRDLVEVAKATGEAFRATGLLFTNLVGLLSGDTALTGAAFSFEKMADAVARVVHWFSLFATAIANVESTLAHLFSALALLSQGKLGDAAKEISAALHGITAPAIGGVAGGVIGAFAGGPGTAILGAGVGSAVAGSIFGRKAAVDQLGDARQLASRAATLAQSVAAKTGIDANLLWAQWAHETGGFSHLGQKNNLAGIRMPGSSQYRAFSSLEDFGGYYSSLMRKGGRYSGVEQSTTISDFAHRLKQGGYYEDTERNYAAGMTRFNRGGLPSIQAAPITVSVNVNQTNASVSDIHAAVKSAVTQASEASNRGVQRNLAEMQSLSWSY